MTWFLRMLRWLTTHRLRMGELPPAKTQLDYDEEQRKLDEVWRRIAKAGQAYQDDHTIRHQQGPYS